MITLHGIGGVYQSKDIRGNLKKIDNFSQLFYHECTAAPELPFQVSSNITRLTSVSSRIAALLMAFKSAIKAFLSRQEIYFKEYRIW
jgi:hypothetical protein